MHVPFTYKCTITQFCAWSHCNGDTSATGKTVVQDKAAWRLPERAEVQNHLRAKKHRQDDRFKQLNNDFCRPMRSLYIKK